MYLTCARSIFRVLGWLGDHHSVDDMVVNVHPHVALQMFFSAFCSYIGHS